MASERTIIIDKDLDASYSIVQLAIHKRSNFSIEKSDSINYRIMVNVSMSAVAYDEHMQVYLNPVTDHKTEITISSSSNVGIEFAGASKNHKNVEDLIESIYDCLETGSGGSMPSVSARPVRPAPTSPPISAPSPVRQTAPMPATPVKSTSRYTRVYLDEEEKYFIGTPIILSACALLHDNKTDGTIAQVKFRNIGAKRIKAITVEIVPFDIAGRPLDSRTKHTYLDLNVGRDEFFGSQTPISMPDAITREIEVNIIEIVFADKTVQDCTGYSCSLLPQRRRLETMFGDAEILKQYRIKTNQKSEYEPTEFEDLWLCTCGAINKNEEEICHICGVSYISQKTEQEKIENVQREIEFEEEREKEREKERLIERENRFKQYWIEHYEEKQQLYLEKSQLDDEKNKKTAEIDTIDLEITKTKRKRKDDVPSAITLKETKAELDLLISQIVKLGAFKVKEKRELQEKIDTLNKKESELQAQVLVDEENNESYCKQRLEELKNRKQILIDEIDKIVVKISNIENELTRER